MLVNQSVMEHLRKYFDLAATHYDERNWGLAAFFAVTVIEECAKILRLRDANLHDKNQIRDAVNHIQKHADALINLLTSSDRFDTLPANWKDLVWSCFSSEKLMQLRNRGLYLRFSRQKELTVPNENVTPGEAAVLVYLSGFVAVELAEYVDLDLSWVNNISNRTEAFRTKHLEFPTVQQKENG